MTDNLRNKDLARIHCLQKDLGLDEDNYRALLQCLTGKTSSKDLDQKQRWHVICEMKRLRGDKATHKPRKTYPGEPAPQTPESGKDRLLAKIKALLTNDKKPWPYAHAIAKRMYQVDLIQWCNPEQLHKIVGVLEINKRRKAKKEADLTAVKEG